MNLWKFSLFYDNITPVHLRLMEWNAGIYDPECWASYWDCATQSNIIALYSRASHVALVVKNPPGNAGDEWDLGQKDPLEEEMITHSTLLAGKIPWTEEPKIVSHKATSFPLIKRKIKVEGRLVDKR